MNSFPSLHPTGRSRRIILVLPAELRAQVLAGLGPPAWPQPRPASQSASPPLTDPVARSEPVAQSVAKLVSPALLSSL